jgi:hypothetical protein
MVKSILEKPVALLMWVLCFQSVLLALAWNQHVSTHQQLLELSSAAGSLKNKTARTLVTYNVISEQDSKLERFLNGGSASEGEKSPAAGKFKATMPSQGSIVTAKSLRTKLNAILADPTASAALRQIKTADVDREYADFFARVFVKPEDLPRVKELLVDLLMARADASVLLPEGLSPEQQQQGVEYVTRQVDEELRQQLGDASYGKIKAYEASATIREDVKTFAARLAEANVPLSTEALERIEARWTEAISAGGNHPLGRMGENTDVDPLISTSADVLTPEQQALLRKFLLDRGKR